MLLVLIFIKSPASTMFRTDSAGVAIHTSAMRKTGCMCYDTSVSQPAASRCLDCSLALGCMCHIITVILQRSGGQSRARTFPERFAPPTSSFMMELSMQEHRHYEQAPCTGSGLSALNMEDEDVCGGTTAETCSRQHRYFLHWDFSRCVGNTPISIAYLCPSRRVQGPDDHRGGKRAHRAA